MAKGIKTGGRTAGTPNKINAEVRATFHERLTAHGCDTVLVLSQIAMNTADCSLCRGSGRKPVRVDGSQLKGWCVRCGGSGKENVKSEIRERAAETLLSCEVPKLKAVAHGFGLGKGKGTTTLTELLSTLRDAQASVTPEPKKTK